MKIAIVIPAFSPELFQGIPWSTGAVLALTPERSKKLSLKTELLPG